MKNFQGENQIIFTNEARCQDCYRCVRVCPVNAIQMKNGQAQVDTHRCILCGTCICECPQNAKNYRNDVEKVLHILKSSSLVAVTIAPSYATVYNEWERKRIPSVLRVLGFDYVFETAEAAYFTANSTAKYIDANPQKSHICSACPAVVNLIEKYYPDKISNLVPVVSPMIAHAKYIKSKFSENVKTVFIGPCIAKKGEAERFENENLIDAVITFEEFDFLIKKEKIDFKVIEESEFDNKPAKFSSLFPLVGGLSKTASLETDILSENSLPVSGYENLKEALLAIDSVKENLIIEPLFCSMGCINGPGIKSDKSLFLRKTDILEYEKDKKNSESSSLCEKLNLSASFRYNLQQKEEEYSEEEIKKILEKTGKANEEDRLNCGACGYQSCREKAIAVLSGMAEIEMCVPFMKRMAEQRTDKIIESSPNGIVILDEQLSIMHMNPAFRTFFKCTTSIVGKPISYLMDPELFILLKDGDKDKIETIVNHENYNLVCHQIFYTLQPENQYVGIFVNITKNISDTEKLDKIKQDTVLQAQELLNHQIEMAQKLAKYLGESTAQGELLVNNLMKIVEDKNRSKIKNDRWLWDIYTSK